MTSLLSRALSDYIPVTSQPNVKPDKSRQVPDPDVGARWGKPASYAWSAVGQMANFTLKDPWVELIENNDNPPRRTRILECGASFATRRLIVVGFISGSSGGGNEGEGEPVTHPGQRVGGEDHSHPFENEPDPNAQYGPGLSNNNGSKRGTINGSGGTVLVN